MMLLHVECRGLALASALSTIRAFAWDEVILFRAGLCGLWFKFPFCIDVKVDELSHLLECEVVIVSSDDLLATCRWEVLNDPDED